MARADEDDIVDPADHVGEWSEEYEWPAGMRPYLLERCHQVILEWRRRTRMRFRRSGTRPDPNPPPDEGEVVDADVESTWWDLDTEGWLELVPLPDEGKDEPHPWDRGTGGR